MIFKLKDTLVIYSTLIFSMKKTIDVLMYLPMDIFFFGSIFEMILVSLNFCFSPRDSYREWYGNGHIVVVYPGYFSIDMVSPFLDVV